MMAILQQYIIEQAPFWIPDKMFLAISTKNQQQNVEF